MNKIIGRKAELNQVNTTFGNWEKENPLWVHIQGEAGSGRTHLINYIHNQLLKDFILLYEYDFNFISFAYPTQIKLILQYIYQNFSNEFESFLDKYPLYLRNAITKLFQNNMEFDDSDSYSPLFFSKLLFHLLSFFSTNSNAFFIFENLNIKNNQQLSLLSKLLNSKIPFIIITSGVEEIKLENNKILCNLIKIDRMSVVDIQNFIQDYFSVREENARFIANHIQIKSEGNPVKIKFLLEALFRDIIPSNPNDFIDIKKLQKIRISPDPEFLFQSLEEKMSKAEISIFSFLSHLIDPLPKAVLRKFLKQFKLNNKQIKIWIEKNYLTDTDFAGDNYVYIKWDQWKQFLRKNIDVKETKKILEFLNNNPILKKQRFPLQLSHLYFDIKDKKTAVKMAHEEGRFLRRLKFNQRAYKRYNFVKRNLSDYLDKEESLKDFFKEIGELQKSLGLYENAFESFLELKNRLGRTERKTWFSTSLQMAEILLEMDAFAEARYLLNDLRIKKVVDSLTKSYAMMLLGDLDKNLGHNDYALAKYQKGLSLLNKGDDAELIYHLYSKIQKIQVDNKENNATRELAIKIHRLLPKESRYAFIINLDLIKLYISQKQFELARDLTLQIFQKVKQRFYPAIMTQTILYLVDVYAFYSKWYLARSHLHQLLKMRPLLIREELRVRILINLAVIEKEIARYGESLRLLSKAEEICNSENFSLERNEIKIHKGHIQMLIHGYLRQRDYLTDVLQWSKENQNHELFIMSSLYLSSYELQQRRFQLAKKHLSEARAQINLIRNEVDKLNYIYYLLQYLISNNELRWTSRIIKIWEADSQGITKFENLIVWFKAKLAFKNCDFENALKEYKRCLARSRKYKLPHLEFHVLKEIIILCHQAEYKKENQKFIKQLKSSFNNLICVIGDEILQKQFHESREVEELRKIGIVLD